MQVVQPTTAAQIFHLLRRQMVRQFRKPLIIFTPKSLLRNKDAGSALNELAKGGFQTVIGEVDEKIEASKVKRVIACSGKVYYDLVNTRKTRNASDVAIVRIEQMYPFPHKSFAAELKKFSNATEVVWVQDEPQNQGPWFQIQHNIFESLEAGQRLSYSGRPASAAPAVGYADKHVAQQKELLETAFSKVKGFVLTK
jgi:2-oxoglutarate dehydrogenase E1 component